MIYSIIALHNDWIEIVMTSPNGLRYSSINKDWSHTVQTIHSTDNIISTYEYICFVHSSKQWLISNIVVYVIFDIIPIFTLIAVNAALIIFAIKTANSSINKMNLLIVILVTVAFIISFLPTCVDDAIIDIEKYGLAQCIAFLSSWTNPFIYLAVNPHFRSFTFRLFRGSVRPVGQ